MRTLSIDELDSCGGGARECRCYYKGKEVWNRDGWYSTKHHCRYDCCDWHPKRDYRWEEHSSNCNAVTIDAVINIAFNVAKIVANPPSIISNAFN